MSFPAPPWAGGKGVKGATPCALAGAIPPPRRAQYIWLAKSSIGLPLLEKYNILFYFDFHDQVDGHNIHTTSNTTNGKKGMVVMDNAITIATHNGSQAHRSHNIREPKVVSKESHIKPHGEFEIWQDEEPRQAYQRLFGKSVKEYNDKQVSKNRSNRVIDDYFDKICNDKKKHPVYEMIIGIYNQSKQSADDELNKTILLRFVEDWKLRNPSLELIGAYYHADEQGKPHVHLDYIPVAHNCTRGMATQTALNKALKEQGFETEGRNTAQIQWEKRENKALSDLCVQFGLQVSHPGRRKQHQETYQFKESKAKEEIKSLEEKKQSLEKTDGMDLFLENANLKAENQRLKETLKRQQSLFDKFLKENSLTNKFRQFVDRLKWQKDKNKGVER